MNRTMIHIENTYKAIREFEHLNNRYMAICIRISTHLISHDNMDNNLKLNLMAIQRYYMAKYLKSIRIRVGMNNKKRSSICSLRVEALYSYAFRKLRNIVKYISGGSILKKMRDFIRFPNVTNVHCERFKIPLYSTLKSELICRVIALYRYKIPNYIRYKRGHY